MQTSSEVTSLRFDVPPLACDCHMHVFGAAGEYPVPRLSSYAPREASLASWRDVAGALGLQRVVVVQPSVYGADNSCTLAALEQVGSMGRGIVQIDAATDDATLQTWHTAGVRGVRLNPKSVGHRDVDALRMLLRDAARRIAPLGWHLQIYAELALLVELAETIRHLPVPTVLDHMGGARAGDDPAALRPLLSLLAHGACWVKLSGAYRVSRQADGFDDARVIARMLVDTNRDRLVWGTDWPHTAHHGGEPRLDAPPIAFRRVNEIALLDGLAEACGDAATFARILVTNPARLYGF